MKENDLKIIKNILWLRLAQVIVNELYKNKEFVVPIHLALGHETLAVAVDSAMQKNDNLFLSHRNMHYNLIRMGTLKEILEEAGFAKKKMDHEKVWKAPELLSMERVSMSF